MRVYLAAPYGSRDIVREYALQLTRIGFEVTSSWLNEQHEINAGTQHAASALSDDQVSGHAYDDLRDVERSHLFVLFTATAVGVEGGGGRHIETGYFVATAGASNIVVVGEPENIFHRMATVTVVADWHEAVVELSSRPASEWRGRARSVTG